MDNLSCVSSLWSISLHRLISCCDSVFGVYQANTPQQWISILDLSTRFKFDDIRHLAITQLSNYDIEPVDKIVLEHTYCIDKQWAYTSYTDLCSRRAPLSSQEAERLGIEVSMLIHQARERLEKAGRSKPNEVAKVVCNLFGLTNPTRASCNIQ